jgi:Fe-S cluster assembly ATP-binding protein
MPLLEIENLHVEIDGKKILKGVDLAVNAGEVHAIMSPNGSGKSTLAYVLAGKDGYEPMAGEVRFDGKNLFDMAPDERAAAGLFLAFQYPNTRRRHHDLSAHGAQRAVQETRRGGTLDAAIHQEGARRGRQARHRPGHAAPRRQCRLFRRREKRNEILQMALLEPRLAVLDCRASFALYNTRAEVDILAQALLKAEEFFT